MKIDKINISNFRQYSGENSIDLQTDGTRNIILIGGKNGFGKTNFLMSLVWCLYGEDFSKIDEGFRREIQKEGNYAKFLKGSLNWGSAKNGDEHFSVEVTISDIELPETTMLKLKAGGNYRCSLKRKFHVPTGDEEFSIKIEGLEKDIFQDNDDRRIFVNDYLIPLEAAKFVFFDAEKIASWAELPTKEEGSVLNDALGKILGLDIYESLISDLEIYSDGLRKESATSVVRQQITTTEKGIELNIEKISDLETEIFKNNAGITELKQRISEYELFIHRNGGVLLENVNLEELYSKRKSLELKQRDLQLRFHELSELIPLAIAAGKLEEVDSHITKQEASLDFKERQAEFLEKNNQLLERLFNTPPFPSDGDISFTKKVFYADKAKSILEKLYGEQGDQVELSFEHDFNRSDKEMLHQTTSYLRKQSKDIFEVTIESFNSVKEEVAELERLILKIESDQEDEEVIRYTNSKSDAERKAEKLKEDNYGITSEIKHLKRTIESDNQRLQLLIKKIEVSEQKKRKLDKANLYIQSLKSFIELQKASKCSLLEDRIFSEMQKLMHKLDRGQNEAFIASVRVEPLPENDGLKISLLDANGEVRQKETLSQGEKQIYISSLIKAILSLSIQEFPIFIDTPLGRLDTEHIEKILLNYYPDLAKQVVLMATNNEIPPSRYKLMQENVAKTYLLENFDNKTHFKPGYFQNYEN